MLDGLVLKTLDGVIRTRIEHWGGNLLQWTKALRTWGEAGVFKLKSKTTQKMANRGITCMFVGYCKSHAENVYRMWNPTTNNVHELQDVTWLKRMYCCQEPTMLEISTGVPSGFRERDANVTSSGNVTINTTPTVNNPSPSVGNNVSTNEVEVQLDNGVEMYSCYPIIRIN